MAQAFYTRKNKEIKGQMHDEFEAERDALDAAFEKVYPASSTVVKTLTGNLTTSELFVLADSTGGNITLTLPAPDSSKRLFVIKKTNLTNDVVIGTAAGLIDGGATYTIAAAANKKAVWLKSDGANYHLVAAFAG